jgi:hypothetical protein
VRGGRIQQEVAPKFFFDGPFQREGLAVGEGENERIGGREGGREGEEGREHRRKIAVTTMEKAPSKTIKETDCKPMTAYPACGKKYHRGSIAALQTCCEFPI